MGDPRAVAVLQKHLPAEVASPEALQMELMFGPHRPLDAIWVARFEQALSDLSEEERAEFKMRIYQELAGIEI